MRKMKGIIVCARIFGIEDINEALAVQFADEFQTYTYRGEE